MKKFIISQIRQTSIKKRQMFLRASDHGLRGIFEYIDKDRDNTISMKELRDYYVTKRKLRETYFWERMNANQSKESIELINWDKFLALKPKIELIENELSNEVYPHTVKGMNSDAPSY